MRRELSRTVKLPQRTLEQKRAYMKQWRERRIGRGLCTYCGKPNATRFRLCAECKKKRATWPSRSHEYLNAWFAKYRKKLGRKYQTRLQHYHFEAKLKAVDKLGGKCIVCGERNPLVLTVNHIDGYKREKPKSGSRGGWELYKSVFESPVNQNVYDLRCFNHQMLYEFERRRTYADIRHEVNEELRRRGISLA